MNNKKSWVVLLCAITFIYTTICIYLSLRYSTLIIQTYLISGLWVGTFSVLLVCHKYYKPLNNKIDSIFTNARFWYALIVLGFVLAGLAVKFLIVSHNTPIVAVDHGTMAYRLRHILARWPGDNYDPFFNAGFSTKGWVRGSGSGIFNCYFLFFPLLKLLDLAHAYNLIVLSTFLLIPILFYLAAYQIRFDHLDATLAAIFATVSSSRIEHTLYLGMVPWMITVFFSIHLIPFFYRFDKSPTKSPILQIYIAFATLLIISHGFSPLLVFPIFFFILTRIFARDIHLRWYVVYCIITILVYTYFNGQHGFIKSFYSEAYSSLQKIVVLPNKLSGETANNGSIIANTVSEIGRPISSNLIKIKEAILFAWKYFISNIFVDVFPPLTILGVLGMFWMSRVRKFRLLAATYMVGVGWFVFIFFVTSLWTFKFMPKWEMLRFLPAFYLLMVIPAAMMTAEILKILSSHTILPDMFRSLERYFVLALVIITPFYLIHLFQMFPRMGGTEFHSWIKTETKPIGRIFLEANVFGDVFNPELMYCFPPPLTFLTGRDIVAQAYISPAASKRWVQRFTKTDPVSPDYIIPALGLKYLVLQSDSFKNFVEQELGLKRISRFKKYYLYDTGIKPSFAYTPLAEVHYDLNWIRVKSPSRTTRLKFMWSPKLQVPSPAVIKPYKLPCGLNIIELQSPPNQEITIRYASSMF